jgi:ABC-2 type transport system permease protein
MIAVATITFLFSTLFKSAMVSTGVSLAIVIVGNIGTQFIGNWKYLAWLFSVHINLVLNWTGDLSRRFGTNLSLDFGIMVLAIWTIVSLIGAIVYFQRKDILSA